MIYDACELISPTGTLALGTVTHSADGPSGFTCELNTNSAPLVVYRADLKQATGGVVVPGKRAAREVVLRGQVLGTTRADLAANWSQLHSFLSDFDGELLGVRFTIPSDNPLFELDATRVVYGAIDGDLSVQRITPLAEEFEVRIVCPDPIAYGEDFHSATLADTPGVNATNAGDATVPAEYTIAGPSSGTITSLRVGNTTTGNAITLSGLTFTTGDELFIDTARGQETVLLNDVSISGTVSLASRWPLLVPGANQLYVTRVAGTGTATGDVEWRDGWVS